MKRLGEFLAQLSFHTGATMEELQKQVRRAKRRISLQRFVNVLGWCWFATLLTAAVLLVIDKYFPMHVPLWGWAGGAFALGLLAAIAWTMLVGGKPLEAAIELDRRFGLKERVSSTLAMPPEDLESEAGQTVVLDATRRVARLEISDKFPIVLPRRLLLPIIPAILAIAVVALLPNPTVSEASVPPKAEDPMHKPQVKKATEVVNKQLAERQKKAEQEGLKEAEQLFKKLEEGTKQMANTPPDREKALSQLNNLSRQLQDRRQQIGGAEKVKEQLNPLKNLEHGPADKFAQALAKGDFNKALEELKDMQKNLEICKLDEKEKEKLADQLNQMKDKVQKLAENQKKAQEEMKKKADEMRKNGQNAEADKLEEQVRQMQNQNQQMDQLQNMANQLGKCAQCLKQGDGKQAAEAMKQAQQAMGDMKKQLDEMEMLDDAMDQLAQAKDKMNCKNCKGEGCGMCQGGKGEGDPNKIGKGMGLGKGRAEGQRPEAKNDTKTYESQVRQKVGKGSATLEGMVEGPNMPGQVQNQIQEQVDSVRRGNTDPLSSRQIPKKYGEQVKEYYDTFREGK
jgi:septal ring factor EnvC (AmiA/AmiB activator)